MHEFGVTERLFKVALAQAKLQDGERIERLKITLDPDSGYVPDAICFYFDQLAKGTPAEGAALDFELTPEPHHIALNTLEITSPPTSSEVARWHIDITGVVQGVGFRPFIYTLAGELGLAGWVRNTAAGVELELQGPLETLHHFLHHLEHDAPPLAHILSVETTEICFQAAQVAGLQILPSHDVDGRSLISPDVATCPNCLAELFDPLDRRYRYPFTNCTHCGPRFTIINGLPYDRPRTVMAKFPLCPPCEAEYRNPDDRRFHAQPVACPECGPHIWYRAAVSDSASVEAGDNALARVVACLTQHQIIALKGLGGFHLACRADSLAAINRLREHKSRPAKALAVMVRNIDEAAKFCHLTETEKALLLSPEAPIVLLRKRLVTQELADGIAPGNGYIGIMLPYTPLHHLLLQNVGVPLVMTSGNLSGEPLCIDNLEAQIQLGGICDGFLFHNRPIAQRCDDSVMVVANPGNKEIPQLIRRSRGLAPLPIPLPKAVISGVPLIAAGADLKNVSAIVTEGQVFLTQHIGDLSHPGPQAEQAKTISSFERLFRIQPEAIVCDMHPDYASSCYARQRAERDGLRLLEVQHHHAHIAGCMAEHGHLDPVIGLSFDGTGYGTDGHIWGGEALLTTPQTFQRLYHLEYLPLPGGDSAIRHPQRIALAYLRTLLPEVDTRAALPDIPDRETRLIEIMLANQINTPLTSSMGRLFDAIASLLGLCREVTYEAQAAIALEAAALEPTALRSRYTGPGYPFALQAGQIKLASLFKAILADLSADHALTEIAYRFHLTVADMALAVAKRIRADHDGLNTVALSGGVWQNRLLLELTMPRLTAAGFEVLVHKAVPANDGGLAYGQAVVASALLNQSTC